MQQKNCNHDVVIKVEFNTHLINGLDHLGYVAVIQASNDLIV